MMHNHHGGIVVIILLAMVVGFAMGILFAKKNSSRSSNHRHEYHASPTLLPHEASAAHKENNTILA